MATIVQDKDYDSLACLLGSGQVITNPVELITYEVDGALRRGHPDAVILPHTANEVVQVVQWAVEHHMPLVARGAGTGLSGGAVAENGGLVLGFSRMKRVLEFDRAGRSAVVEPGVINLRLDEDARKVGLFFPPDPASGRATTIGGNMGENSGGPHCFKYGVTTNFVTGMEVVLADGRIVHLGGQAVDYPEYDFTGLLIGSEGTLGITTRATVRLLRNPPAVKTTMAAFDTVQEAGEAVSAVIARGLVPATLEMMDQKMMGIIEDFSPVGLPIDAGAVLIIEVDGYPESLSLQMEEIVAVLREHNARGLRAAETAEERERIWSGRKSAFGAMARLAPSYYVLDGTVPRSKLGSTLATIDQICKRLDLVVAYVFHAGDGNLHPLILIEDPSDEELLERIHLAGQLIMELCVSQEGSITGEHGVGIEKREFMNLMYNADELGAMLDVKNVFDPHHLLNPGKIFPHTATTGSQVEEERPPAPLPDSPQAPSSTEEAAEVMKAWTGSGHSACVRGGGTKSDRVSPGAGDRLLTTSSLQGIHRYAREDLYVTVGAGTPLADLQAELAADRTWVPLMSPWPESTVGGILATNFNAPLRMRYGGIRDLVLAVTVVLPDGRIIRVGRPVVKNVAGYDLPKLFVGAHGTLGLITESTIKIIPLPRARASLIAPVEDLSLGLEWGRQLLPVCLTASALLLCHGCDELSSAPYALIYTAEGVSEDVMAELAQARTVLEAAGANSLLETDEPSGSQAWANWIQASLPGPGAGDETRSALVRVGVPPKDAPGIVKDLASTLDETGYIADLASGLLYVRGFRGVQDLSTLRDMARSIGGYAVLLSGADSFEEAIDPWGYQPDSLGLMQRLKSRWDPGGLLNPAALVSG